MSEIVNVIGSIKTKFVGIVEDEKIFRKEANFAVQSLQSNNFLMSCATKNTQALQDAIVNVASLGTTLNPSEKKAYLVPRGGKICLDISYMGLIDLAIKDGAIIFAEARVVRKNDNFKLNAIGEQPTHDFDCFASEESRGEIVGAYCVAKLPSGDYISDTINLDDVERAMKTSESHKAFKSGKAKSSIWNDFKDEMIRKTVVKRASKYWKGSSRLSNAISHLNIENGEGFNKNIIEYGDVKSIDSLLDKPVDCGNAFSN